MTVIHLPPYTAAPDAHGHALYQQLMAHRMPDLAVQCSWIARSARDAASFARAMEDIRRLTQDAELTFEYADDRA